MRKNRNSSSKCVYNLYLRKKERKKKSLCASSVLKSVINMKDECIIHKLFRVILAICRLQIKFRSLRDFFFLFFFFGNNYVLGGVIHKLTIRKHVETRNTHLHFRECEDFSRCLKIGHTNRGIIIAIKHFVSIIFAIFLLFVFVLLLLLLF